jgi:hypothetical protein
MLTVETSSWPAGKARLLWVIEFDTEYGSIQAFGPAEILHEHQGYLESGATGGFYREPRIVAGMVEVWIAERHYLAVFGSEEAMIAGAHMLATAWHAILPASIYLALTAPPEQEK